MSTKAFTSLVVFIVCCGRGLSTTTESPECADSINKAQQYITNPCGGPCLAMNRDVMQLREISRIINLEITRYLKQYNAHGFLFPLQLTNPKLDLPTFGKNQNLSFEEKLMQAYKDLSVYFSYCLQIENFERKLSLQTENLRYILSIESKVFRFMRVIMAGRSDHQNISPFSRNVYTCLSNDEIVKSVQTKAVLKHLSEYFQQLKSYLMWL